MSKSRIPLTLTLVIPALLMALVVMGVTVALLVSQEPSTDTRAGVARVGEDVAVVVVVDEVVTDGLIDSGLVAPALALIPAFVLAWIVAGRVKRVIARAHAEVDAADEVRRSRLQEIVHELRTPLAVMGTNLELAASEAEGQPGAAGYIDAAYRAVGRMARTIDDLAGHGRLAVEQHDGPVDLGLIAKAVAAEHSGPARARGVEVVVDGSLPTTVPSVDPAAVRTAIGNFLGNAVRLAPRGSSVSVEWGELHKWAWIAVTDEGPGIAPHLHARAFERGWRGQHDRDREIASGEAGLGLTIARQLTEAQGGAVTLESEEGGGATFTVWLPLELGADPTAIVAPDRHPSRNHSLA